MTRHQKWKLFSRTVQVKTHRQVFTCWSPIPFFPTTPNMNKIENCAKNLPPRWKIQFWVFQLHIKISKKSLTEGPSTIFRVQVFSLNITIPQGAIISKFFKEQKTLRIKFSTDMVNFTRIFSIFFYVCIVGEGGNPQIRPTLVLD